MESILSSIFCWVSLKNFSASSTLLNRISVYYKWCWMERMASWVSSLYRGIASPLWLAMKSEETRRWSDAILTDLLEVGGDCKAGWNWCWESRIHNSLVPKFLRRLGFYSGMKDMPGNQMHKFFLGQFRQGSEAMDTNLSGTPTTWWQFIEWGKKYGGSE
jgi:hypothetical protein